MAKLGGNLMSKIKFGRFELSCIVVNVLIYRIFTRFPKMFSDIAGSGSALTAVYTGIVFLALLGVILMLYKYNPNKNFIEIIKERFGNVTGNIVRIVVGAYLIFSAVFAVSELSTTLKVVAFPLSSQLFTATFLLITAVIVAFRRGSIFRIHGILMPFVVLSLVLIISGGIKYVDVFNITPAFGNGYKEVFGTGLKTLFLYSDIILIFLMAPNCEKGVNFRKVVMISAMIGTVLNILAVTVIALSTPEFVAKTIDIPMYPLTKVGYHGKIFQRFDVFYMISLSVSGILYLALNFSTLFEILPKPKISPNMKKVGTAMLVAILCVVLTGCHDAQEIEETAYIIAIGVDTGNEFPYRYTFQFANPLATGENMAEMKKPEESEESENSGNSEKVEKTENKSVNNITVEAENFYIAWNELGSFIGKSSNMSHIKLIVFSEDIAALGVMNHAKLLMNEREIRPNTNVCISTGSAKEMLKNIKPTLEISTIKYYELLLENDRVPYAPIVELRELVNKISDPEIDAVLPLINNSELCGMGIFKDEKMVKILDGNQAQIYKLIEGKVLNQYMKIGDTTLNISTRQKSKID
ncbi:MAG: GerAB/ArcD/ProY family transporter, partial [Oscillospiraceae bacterium]